MKKQQLKAISLILLALSVGFMFVPSFSFSVLESAVEDSERNLVKLEEKWMDAQAKYDEMAASGDAVDKLGKQQERVDKALEKFEEGKADHERIIAAANGPKKTLSLFQAGLPEQTSVNRVIINENNNLYKDELILSQFTPLKWAALSLMVLAFFLESFSGTGRKSSVRTISALMELIAVVVVLFIVLRQLGVPIKSPYSNANASLFAWLPILLLIFSISIKSLNYLGVKRSLIYIFAVTLSLLSIFPFYVMIINSTRDTYQIQQGLSLLPGKALANNWNILTGKNFNVAVGLRNSAIIAFGSTILSVYFSALCAYGLTVYEFRGRKILFSFIVGIIMIPAQLASIGFYMFMYRIGWVDSFLPLILPAIAAPSTVFFMRQYMMANFQISLVEASRIDGAREIFTFNRIVVPILMPAMATMAIFSVITSWNNYLTPLMLLKNPDMATLPMMVRTLRGDIYRTEYGSIYLGLTLSAAPLLIVYFSLSKYIIQGVALGGVKE